jgi:hypothetical protein
MANQKLTQLTAASALADTDLFYLVTNVGVTPTSQQIAVSILKAALASTLQQVTTAGNTTTDAVIIQNELTVGDGGSSSILLNDSAGGQIEADGGQVTFYHDESVTISKNGGDANEIVVDSSNYNATTNTPTLSNTDTNRKSIRHKVSVAGSQDFGAGSITFGLNDIISNDGSIWYKSVDNNQVSAIFPIGFAFGDETTDIAVGTDKLTFQMPNFATTITGVSVNVKTAPTGSVATFDLNEAGVSVLSTKITIDAGETTSVTAATPPVISDSAIAANAIMTVDIDGVGSTVAGVAPKLWIYYTIA